MGLYMSLNLVISGWGYSKAFVYLGGAVIPISDQNGHWCWRLISHSLVKQCSNDTVVLIVYLRY